MTSHSLWLKTYSRSNVTPLRGKGSQYTWIQYIESNIDPVYLLILCISLSFSLSLSLSFFLFPSLFRPVSLTAFPPAYSCYNARKTSKEVPNSSNTTILPSKEESKKNCFSSVIGVSVVVVIFHRWIFTYIQVNFLLSFSFSLAVSLTLLLSLLVTLLFLCYFDSFEHPSRAKELTSLISSLRETHTETLLT